MEIEKYITIGHIPLPNKFSSDLRKQAFPEITLKICGTNGEMYMIEFLVWSQVKQALYCWPCRMSWHTNGVISSRSVLASPGGWTASAKWRKLSVRVREHEKSKSHEEGYIACGELERHVLSVKGLTLY